MVGIFFTPPPLGVPDWKGMEFSASSLLELGAGLSDIRGDGLSVFMPVIHCLPLTMDGMFETYAPYPVTRVTASHGPCRKRRCPRPHRQSELNEVTFCSCRFLVYLIGSGTRRGFKESLLAGDIADNARRW